MRKFFELRISSSELTGATMLVITDFAYPDEMADSRDLWDHQDREHSVVNWVYDFS